MIFRHVISMFLSLVALVLFLFLDASCPKSNLPVADEKEVNYPVGYISKGGTIPGPGTWKPIEGGYRRIR